MHTPLYDALTESDLTLTESERAALKMGLQSKIDQFMRDAETLASSLLAMGHDAGPCRDKAKEAGYEMLGMLLKRQG